jgi:hypothetical protein
MDLLAFNFTNMLDWIKVIISHGATLKILKEDHVAFFGLQEIRLIMKIFLLMLLMFLGKLTKYHLSICQLGRMSLFHLKKNGCHLRRISSKSILIQQYEILFQLKLLCVGII